MASITIRDLDDETQKLLRIRAAKHHRSMEEEIRRVLRTAVNEPVTPTNLGETIHGRFAALGRVELELPSQDF